VTLSRLQPGSDAGESCPIVLTLGEIIMSIVKIIALSVAGIVVLAGLWFSLRRLHSDRTLRRIENALRADPDPSGSISSGDPAPGSIPAAEDEVFRADLVADLPEPARLFFLHAISPGTPLSAWAEIDLTGSMRQSPETPRMSIRAREVLHPGEGFIWYARARSGPVSVRVVDHYYREAGAVDIALFGLVPMGRESGTDVARSSRGRLAAESIWIPTALLPREGVRWEAVDDERARVMLTIDGEELALILTIDADGRCREVMMQRWGNAGVEEWQELPYGFAITGEVTAAGITVGERFEGGWWYGTDRYDPGSASIFTISEILFR